MKPKKIIITGSATRIGAAIAKTLSGYDIKITLHYNKSLKEVRKLKTELEKKGSEVYLIKADLSKKDNEKKKEASKIAEQINGKEYSVKKLSTENNELYGSVKPTEISKLIQEENKIEIKPSMIQPVDEIKAIGKFKVKISLHSEVDAEITINVSSADTIQ